VLKTLIIFCFKNAKKDYSDSDLSDSSYYSNYELSDDGLMVVDDDSSNSSNSVDSNLAFRVKIKLKTSDLGRSTFMTNYWMIKCQVLEGDIKRRAILMNLDTPIDFFNYFLNNAFLEEI